MSNHHSKNKVETKVVSRKDNEEIYFNKDHKLSSAAEKYAGEDDHQPNSGLETHQKIVKIPNDSDVVEQKDLNKQRTLEDFEQGRED